MEKSQWDLKQFRLQKKKFSRLDDFAQKHKGTLTALLREYADSDRRKKKVRATSYFFFSFVTVHQAFIS